MASEVIQVKTVSKSYAAGIFGQTSVLSDIDFSVRQGSVVGFLGPNGAGKSTTILAILNLINIDSGSIQLFGKSNQDKETRSKIGFCAENFSSYKTESSWKVLLFLAALNGLPKSEAKDRAAEALQVVDLYNVAHKKIKTFSKGMLQRLGIAQAIVHKPELLLLDEPMSGLDPEGRLLIASIIKSHKQQGGTVLFSSHILTDIAELCDEILIIRKGKIAFKGKTPQNLEDTYRTFAVQERRL
jgi:ABC-2 type transport system ATP-binding protein